jgi:predicted phosphodiesterase
LIHLWQAKARLKRLDFSQKQIAELFKSALAKVKVALKTPIPKYKHTPTGKMFMLGVPDLHLGKYAWSEETGHGNWDCKLAKAAWEEAIDDLLSRAPECDECWFPIGNDFFNVDDYLQNTTAGTHQDEDGRWQKTFRYGVEMTKWAIARCRKKFPHVKVIMVYGNHDRQRSWYLGELLLELSEFMDGVEVDNRPLDRKYFKWGQTGIGIAHGDRLKEKDLSNLCQNEAREIWGETKRFELILGHIHNPVVKTLGGVLTRWLSALCPPDMWHSKSGYTMAEKTATGFVYDMVGMVMQLTHYPQEK